MTSSAASSNRRTSLAYCASRFARVCCAISSATSACFVIAFSDTRTIFWHPVERGRNGVGLRHRTRVPGEAGLGRRGSFATRSSHWTWCGTGWSSRRSTTTRRQVVDPLKDEVRRQGLWATHIGPELGGQGYGQLKLALLNEILGRSSWAPIVFGCQAPDTGNAEIIAHYGTPEQKERYLRPLLERRALLLLLDDRAPRRRRPDDVHDPRRARRRRVGDQRVEVLLVEREDRRRSSSSWR